MGLFRRSLLGKVLSSLTEESKGPGFPHFEIDIHEYGLKFTQLSHYAPKMVKDMRSRMSLFVVGLGRASIKEGRAAMLIGYMDISRLMVYFQQVEDEK